MTYPIRWLVAVYNTYPILKIALKVVGMCRSRKVRSFMTRQRANGETFTWSQWGSREEEMPGRAVFRYVE